MLKKNVTAILEKPDMRIILDVYRANAEFGMPYLLPERKWKRAAKLEERGLLRKKAGVMQPAPGCSGYVVTNAGIEAYSVALAFVEEIKNGLEDGATS